MPDHNSPQPRSASRILVSVRRSIKPNAKRHGRSHSHSQSMHMYSTPEETSPRSSTTFREPPSASVRPTIEQIAMGLHVSRTPHLHSPPHCQHSRSPSHSHRSSSSRPTTPLRSSLKKPSLASSSASASEPSSTLHTLPLPTAASASSSTITSTSFHMIPGTAVSRSASSVSPRLQPAGSASTALAAIKLRVAKLLPGERKRSASSPTLAIEAVAAGQKKSTAVVTRKAVRFESLGDVEQPR